MAIALLIISGILFIVTFGIHAMVTSREKWQQPMYTNNPLFSSIPWISGFVLPVIPFTIVLEANWILIFFINLVFVFLLGPPLTKGFLNRFASGKGLGKDLMISLISGIVVLIIGLLVYK